MATAAVGIGSALLGGYFQNKAAGKAADATTNASNQAIAANQQALAQMRADGQPFMQAGYGALSDLTGNNFKESPGYQYAKAEMLGGLNAQHAAMGSLHSGGTDIDRMRHLEGLASQEYGNWWNQRMGLAQLGQASAAGVGAAGMGAASNIGGYLGAAGLGQANGALMQGNNWANTANQIGTGLSGLLGKSSYGGGSNASQFGLPSPSAPYANASYGQPSPWFS